MATPLLKLASVGKYYPGNNGRNRCVALDNISFDIHRGKAVGLVGRSGAGKSTLARLILGIESPTTGNIFLDGPEIAGHKKDVKKKVQIIWQDASQYLNPFFTVFRLVSEPLEIFNIGNDNETNVKELAEAMIELSGSKSKINYVSMESVYGKSYEDISRRIPDVSKMNHVLNVKAEVPLKEGLKRTIDWFLSNPDICKLSLK